MIRRKIMLDGEPLGEIVISTQEEAVPAAPRPRAPRPMPVVIESVFMADSSRCHVCNDTYPMTEPQIFLKPDDCDAPLEVCPTCLAEGHAAIQAQLPQAIASWREDAYWMLSRARYFEEALALGRKVSGATLQDYQKAMALTMSNAAKPEDTGEPSSSTNPETD